MCSLPLADSYTSEKIDDLTLRTAFLNPNAMGTSLRIPTDDLSIEMEHPLTATRWSHPAHRAAGRQDSLDDGQCSRSTERSLLDIKRDRLMSSPFYHNWTKSVRHVMHGGSMNVGIFDYPRTKGK